MMQPNKVKFICIRNNPNSDTLLTYFSKKPSHFSLKFLISIVFILLFFNSKLYGMSPRREYLVLRNFSNHNVIVNMEFWHGPGSNIESSIAWHQNMFDMTLSIRDMLAVVDSNMVWPNESVQIIGYYPLGPQLVEKYIMMFSLPFIDKMRAIFRVFEVVYNNETIITLDNIEEWIIHEREGIYVLEIHDKNNKERVKNRRALIGEVSRTNPSNSDDFLQTWLEWSIAMSLPNGNIYVPDMIPGYSPEERQALLMHQIEHQGYYQNYDPQDIFQQLVREAALHHLQGIDVYETRNHPSWYLEYDAQRVQDRSLRIIRNQSRTE
jgi:hypothetical protein